MFSKAEASLIRQEFWTTFGKYMLPVPPADDEKVNWVNYKTGIKYLYFRMEAENHTARASIEITHPDLGIQELFFEQFKELKMMLHNYLGEDWNWQLHHTGIEGKVISLIYKELPNVSIFNRNDWPKLISFYKTNIIALDKFWSIGKYSFDALK